jgi:hypothetical protein
MPEKANSVMLVVPMVTSPAAAAAASKRSVAGGGRIGFENDRPRCRHLAFDIEQALPGRGDAVERA